MARRQVLETVLDYPGLRVVDIARCSSLRPNLVEYHLDALLDAELLVEATYENHRRFYPIPGPGAPSLADAEWLALLREPVPLHLALLLLDADGPLTHTALHQQMDLAKSTLSFHLGKLVEAGLLGRPSTGGYEPSDRTRLHRLVIAHRPVPDALATHFSLWMPLYRQATQL